MINRRSYCDAFEKIVEVFAEDFLFLGDGQQAAEGRKVGRSAVLGELAAFEFKLVCAQEILPELAAQLDRHIAEDALAPDKIAEKSC